MRQDAVHGEEFAMHSTYELLQAIGSGKVSV